MTFLEAWHLFSLAMPHCLGDSNLCLSGHMCRAEKEMRALSCPVQMEVSQGQRPNCGGCLVVIFPPQWHHHFHSPTQHLPAFNLLFLTSQHLFFETPLLTFPGSYIFNPLGSHSRKNGFAPVAGILGLWNEEGHLYHTGGCSLTWNLKAKELLFGWSSCCA